MVLATALATRPATMPRHAPDLPAASASTRAAGVERIAADSSVAQAARLLARPGIGALLVMESGSEASSEMGDGAVVGLLTARDLFRAVAAEGPAVYDRCVWLITDSDFPAIDVAASAGERLRAFCDRKVDHIALMDGCRVSGVLSIWDCAGSQTESRKELVA